MVACPRVEAEEEGIELKKENESSRFGGHKIRVPIGRFVSGLCGDVTKKFRDDYIPLNVDISGYYALVGHGDVGVADRRIL